MRRYTHLTTGLFALLVVFLAGSTAFAGDNDSILAKLHKVSTIAATVPANGDVKRSGQGQKHSRQAHRGPHSGQQL